jgi:hypothetical protein
MTAMLYMKLTTSFIVKHNFRTLSVTYATPKGNSHSLYADTIRDRKMLQKWVAQ